MTDAIAGAVWFALNGSAVAAAWRLVRRAWPDDSLPQAAMHSLVMLWSAIVVVCLLLGGLGVLTPTNMGALMLLLSALVHCLGVRQSIVPSRGRAATFLDACRSGQETQMAAPQQNEGIKNEGINRRTRRRWLPCILWVAMFAVAGGMVTQRLLEFPKYWDDLMYHLPFVDHWLQDRSIFAPATSEWTNACNAEILGLWSVAPFTGDFWIGLANAPVVALLALGMVELGRQIGLSAPMRHAAAIAALATNVVLVQLTDLENDTAVAALFVAGLAYGLRYSRFRRTADLALCACALGLLPGVKYYA
ncbi:MAG: hypothetical protein ACREHD_05875, partial [Pirellulales bacterium]